MINILSITEEQADYAVLNMEFPDSIKGAEEKVIIILTQGWCPQWRSMCEWLPKIDTTVNVNIYVLIYDKISRFKEFKSFKENVFDNYEIPYLRYYKNGLLYKESNYISPSVFKEILEI